MASLRLACNSQYKSSSGLRSLVAETFPALCSASRAFISWDEPMYNCPSFKLPRMYTPCIVQKFGQVRFVSHKINALHALILRDKPLLIPVLYFLHCSTSFGNRGGRGILRNSRRFRHLFCPATGSPGLAIGLDYDREPLWPLPNLVGDFI